MDSKWLCLGTVASHSRYWAVLASQSTLRLGSGTTVWSVEGGVPLSTLFGRPKRLVIHSFTYLDRLDGIQCALQL
jgi:hypothetical protein